MSNGDKLLRARQQYENAIKALAQAIRDEYPIGTVVMVEIGRGRFPLKIVGYADAWRSEPEILRGKNINSDFVRDFHASKIVELI